MPGPDAPLVSIVEAPRESRQSLLPLLDRSFQGIYLWHARRTLRSVQWVRMAVRENAVIGLSLVGMVGQRTGYVYYVAVMPSERGSGVGGAILDDALRFLEVAGAFETLAAVQKTNVPSMRLFRSRGFVSTSFRALVKQKGIVAAAVLWARMVVAPGERVLLKSHLP